MKRWKGTAAALVLGMTVGVGMAFGFAPKAEAAPVPDAAGACGTFECRSNADCTTVCQGFSGVCRINSCQSYCLCTG